MTTRRVATGRVEEEIVNAGVPTQGNQTPSQEQVPRGGQDPINPLVMSDGETRVDFLNLTKVMETQDQDMTAKANWIVGPCVNQNTSTMASHLRDFTWINP